MAVFLSSLLVVRYLPKCHLEPTGGDSKVGKLFRHKLLEACLANTARRKKEDSVCEKPLPA